MTPAEFVRRNTGRLAGTVAAVGLAACAAIGTARAEHPAAASPLGPALAPKAAARPTPLAVQSPAISFAAPLPGFAVNSSFGLRQLEFEPQARPHEGVDIAAPAGEAIHATAPGAVARTGLSASYGHFVEVAHADGLTSFYAHMSRTAGLKPGTQVQAGAVLGFVGSTGHSTGPHLHFEIRKDGAPLDTQRLMNHRFAALSDLHRALAQAPRLLFAHAGASWRTFAASHVNGRVRTVIDAPAAETPPAAEPVPETSVETSTPAA